MDRVIMQEALKSFSRVINRFVRHGRCVAKAKRGSALVELALSMPILIVLFVGAAEFASLSYTAIEVSDAAKAAVQYGTQSIAYEADTTGIQTAATNDAANITLGPTTVTPSCICSDGTASTCAVGDCSSSTMEHILTVQTQATVDPGFHLVGFPTSYTLYGQAVQKVLQ